MPETKTKVVRHHNIGDITIKEIVDEAEGSEFHVDVSQDGSAWIVEGSLDKAVLTALGYKYDGDNSQFSSFAQRMLGIK